MTADDSAPVPPSSPTQPSKPTVQPPQRPPYAPPFLWRLGSVAVVGLTGLLSRTFLLTCTAKFETHGLDGFLQLLDERKEPETRTRGLITVSNHLSVVDDPLIWGVLPFRYMATPDILRWGLGSHDLMFKNRLTATFFTLGQCLPTHRIQHSQYGGVFQPTITESIRLLSAQPFTRSLSPPTSSQTKLSSTLTRDSPSSPEKLQHQQELIDPFTDPTAPLPPLSPTFTTTGVDTFPSPAYYPTRRHGWIHVFPEGRIHQHRDQLMRYFRWGVSRMILESEPCPDVVPMWIEGLQEVMPEEREFPRPLPRLGAHVRVAFGRKMDVDEVFGPLRERWRRLKEEARVRGEMVTKSEGSESGNVSWDEVGVVDDEWLKYGEEAKQLRIEVAKRVRDELLKMREERGWADEDPRAALAKAWRLEPGAWGARFLGVDEE